MIFSLSRRRFIAIASSAVGAAFVPGATTGAVADLILSEKDRYAETVRLINQSMAAFPDFYWKNGGGNKFSNEMDFGGISGKEWRERHDLFLARSDELFSHMLSSFDEAPTVEQVRPLFQMAESIPELNEEGLKAISAGLVPIAVAKSMIAGVRAPYHVTKMKQFAPFAQRYKGVIIEAATAPCPV